MYIDAYHDRMTNTVKVLERNAEGIRKFVEYPAEWSFYHEDKNGQYKSLYGTACSKIVTKTQKELFGQINKYKHSGEIYESDIGPVLKVLENEYSGGKLPVLNKTFFDIETAFSKKRGYAQANDPFNEITAISFYKSNEKICWALVCKPAEMSQKQAETICNAIPGAVLCENEAEILKVFLDMIEDTDILTGWNSESYDIPYIVGRITRVLGKSYLKKLCLWGNLPTKKVFERYGKKQTTYSLIGRLHLDYLQLYKKYTYRELPNFTLDAVGKLETGQQKIPYNGSLDDLYHSEFKKFIEYSIQDTMLLKKIDDKLKFIDLTNTISHENCILMPATMGAVGLSDNAIILEAHRRGFVVNNRAKKYDNTEIKKSTSEQYQDIIESKIAGAYVAEPKKGFNQWLGSVDLTSLYPSIIMALNLSPETLIGQIVPASTNAYLLKCMMENKGKMKGNLAEAWAGIFETLEVTEIHQRSQAQLTVEFEHRKKVHKQTDTTAENIHDFIFHNDTKEIVLSANGTLFSQEKQGVIASLMSKWFSDRKTMSKKAKMLAKQMNGMDKTTSEYQEIEKQFIYWDRRQLVRKIGLNSVYGALTNEGSRFYDRRLGQSITLTGRSIARHMASTINQILTGEKDHRGPTIIYGDTDSVDGKSIIDTSNGKITIEQLFNQCDFYWSTGGKEYAYSTVKVKSYHPAAKNCYHRINYIYRHKVSKNCWQLVDEHDNMVKITDDHSIMIYRDNMLMKLKPSAINIITDRVISGNHDSAVKIKSIKQIAPFDDEYVYDIGINHHINQWFFANNILVHNSVYFSAWPIKDDIIKAGFEFNEDNVVMLYDKVAEETNKTFPQFMGITFNCKPERAARINANREICAISAIFVKKKKYSVLVYDDEGKRLKNKKLKIMGLDTQRSDTPKFIQEFLRETLRMTLESRSEADVMEYIKNFRMEFRKMNPWEMGTPKGCKSVSKYTEIEDKTANSRLPGHIRAAYNYNKLKKLLNDVHSMPILDGSKTIFCKLRNNEYGIKTIAYPINETNLPEWFKLLPFDIEEMEHTLIDKKLDNIIGVLDFNIGMSKNNSILDDLFTI